VFNDVISRATLLGQLQVLTSCTLLCD